MVTERARDLTLKLTNNKSVEIIIDGRIYPFQVENIRLEPDTQSPEITGFIGVRPDEDFDPCNPKEAK